MSSEYSDLAKKFQNYFYDKKFTNKRFPNDWNTILSEYCEETNEQAKLLFDLLKKAKLTDQLIQHILSGKVNSTKILNKELKEVNLKGLGENITKQGDNLENVINSLKKAKIELANRIIRVTSFVCFFIIANEFYNLVTFCNQLEQAKFAGNESKIEYSELDETKAKYESFGEELGKFEKVIEQSMETEVSEERKENLRKETINHLNAIRVDLKNIRTRISIVSMDSPQFVLVQGIVSLGHFLARVLNTKKKSLNEETMKSIGHILKEADFTDEILDHLQDVINDAEKLASQHFDVDEPDQLKQISWNNQT